MSPLIWHDREFQALSLTGEYRLLVIDSWRQHRGKSFGLGQHAARFTAAVAEVGTAISEQQWREMWHRINACLRSPENQNLELFPRVSLLEFSNGNRHIGFEVRPAPTVRKTTTLAYFAGEDRRAAPLLKGPDLALFAELKAGVESDVDDLIITDTDGACLETTTGALALWKDDVLVFSDRLDKQLPSVTLYQVFQRAREIGQKIVFAPIFPSDLAAGPVWFLNALHGISPVTQIHVRDEVLAPPRHPRESEWGSWWWSQFGARADDHRHPGLSAFA